MVNKVFESAGLTKTLICLGLSAMVIIVTQEVFFPIKPLKDIDRKHIDERFQKRGALNIKDTAKVVIVEITQKTYDGIPYKWPWPRSVFARVIRNLNRAGAKAIGIDIVMSSPDQTNKQNDSDMVAAIRQYKNVVVAGKLPDVSNTKLVKKLDDGSQVEVDQGVQVAKKEENYQSVYFKADSSVGIVNVVNDGDGVYRRYAPFYLYNTNDSLIPSFGFAVVNKYFGLPGLNLAAIKPTAFDLNGVKIPKYDRISTLLNYYGPFKSFKYYDLLDIVDDAEFKTSEELQYETDLNTFDDPDFGIINQNIFKDKIVLIGSTMPEDKDILPISYAIGDKEGDNLIAGVEIHATAIQNILSKNFLYAQPRWVEILITIALVFMVFFFSSMLKEFKLKIDGLLLEIINFVLVFGLLVGYRFVSFYMFNNHNYVMNLVSANGAIIMGYMGSTAYHFIMERRQKGMIKGMFSQYVNASIVDELITNPANMKLGGQRKQITVFFSDIAGFSTFSENKEPEDLISFLNEYLSAMTKCVFDNRGTLDKYIGDAVMAFWGAPAPIQDHAYQACKTALEMQKVVNELNEKWQAEGQPHILARMGINTGDMVVGNVGGTQRFDYTVMGDNVNLGSRLEGANKEYGTKIMIADTTYEQVKDLFITRELDYLVVKGRTKPIKVYELVGFLDEALPEPVLKAIEVYKEGLALFRAQNFAESIDKFLEALNINPGDHPSQVYIKRAKHYIVDPPGENWDGVFIMKTK